MAEPAPRRHAMVDFHQHQERVYVVLEEDHEKVEQENARFRCELGNPTEAAREKEADYFRLQSEMQNLWAGLRRPPAGRTTVSWQPDYRHETPPGGHC
ncbi:hypothetical protein D9M71_425840 [compost metagenome]